MTTTIDLTASAETRYGGELITSEVRLQITSNIRGLSGGYRLAIIPEGVPHRRIYMGEMVTEQWAFLSALPVVISAHPIHEETVEAAIGDRIKVEGQGEWEIVEGGTKHQPELVLVRK